MKRVSFSVGICIFETTINRLLEQEELIHNMRQDNEARNQEYLVNILYC